jgi:hypothetical protein
VSSALAAGGALAASGHSSTVYLYNHFCVRPVAAVNQIFNNPPVRCYYVAPHCAQSCRISLLVRRIEQSQALRTLP